MSHLTKDHYPETSVHPAKARLWHRDSEQSKDMVCKRSSLASALVQTRAPACTAPPLNRLALCFGYWCEAPSPLQATTFALCLCRQVHKRTDPKYWSGKRIGSAASALPMWPGNSGKLLNCVLLVYFLCLSVKNVVLHLLTYARNR